MIEISNRDALSYALLKDLAGRKKKNDRQEDTPAIKGSLRFRMVRALQQVEPIFQNFSEARDAIFTSYGGSLKPVEGLAGVSKWEFDVPENRAKAQKETETLLSMRTEIDVEKIKLKELEGFIELTADEIAALFWLVDLD